MSKKKKWNAKETLKKLDELYGKANEVGEDLDELKNISERNYTWKVNEDNRKK